MILIGDALEQLRTLPDASAHCCVTSPPYWGLRDYGCDGQLGLEQTPDEYIENIVKVFREVRRVLRDDGTLWLNIGDTYSGGGFGTQGKGGQMADRSVAKQRCRELRKTSRNITGLKPKDLVGIPWRLAFALQADGWILRSDIIWHKPNPMPESVGDRCTKAHEYVFMFSKRQRYYWDRDAVKERGAGRTDLGKMTNPARLNQGGEWTSTKKNDDGRNIRDVWTIATQPFSGAHFACMPPKLAERCILAGCPEGGTVLDPFFGAGTTGLVANRLRREHIGIELNPEYAAMAERRIEDDCPLFNRSARGSR